MNSEKQLEKKKIIYLILEIFPSEKEIQFYTGAQ